MRILSVMLCLLWGSSFLVSSSSLVLAQEDMAPLRTEAAAGMKRAVEYFRTRVALRGGYVYYYSLDLKTRWGEGRASDNQIWVQPPGTPTVGLAFLRAYEATGDKFYLEAATEAAEALLYGQVVSGGWEHVVDFDPKGNRSAQYRNGKGRGKPHSTLDDDCTQSTLLFLMQCDQAHQFHHAAIHEAVEFAKQKLLAAQFPNGGFPQVWSGPAPDWPVRTASYPDYDWKTENRIKEYWNLYTLNDDLAGDMARTLTGAWEIYHDESAKAALIKLGDFLIRAQMPEPQPAWAQQYTPEMRPAWARKFEPPAITTHESQDAIGVLLVVHRLTGDPKYLEPIPRALQYLRTCVQPDGSVPRFMELKTNKPLYMNIKYELTYDDGDLPQHYGWKQKPRLDQLEKEFQETRAGTWKLPAAKSAKSLAKNARTILSQLDDQGRWVNKTSNERLAGQPKFGNVTEYLSSEVFSEHVESLAVFLKETQNSKDSQGKR